MAASFPSIHERRHFGLLNQGGVGIFCKYVQALVLGKPGSRVSEWNDDVSWSPGLLMSGPGATY